MGGSWPSVLADSSHLLLQFLRPFVKNKPAPASSGWGTDYRGGGQAPRAQNISILHVFKDGLLCEPEPYVPSGLGHGRQAYLPWPELRALDL